MMQYDIEPKTPPPSAPAPRVLHVTLEAGLSGGRVSTLEPSGVGSENVEPLGCFQVNPGLVLWVWRRFESDWQGCTVQLPSLYKALEAAGADLETNGTRGAELSQHDAAAR